MRQRIDLDGLYAEALLRARMKTDDAVELNLMPDLCPFTPNDLLVPGADVRVLARKLGAP